MNRPDLPDEEEQYRTLADIVRAMGGRPVTVRTLDVGGEKLATSLGEQIGESVNPALGLRAIRLSLREPQLLRPQLAAMLRAGVHGPLRILRSEEHTSELQSLMRISYAVFCLQKKKKTQTNT